jgi:hypothetical protein
MRAQLVGFVASAIAFCPAGQAGTADDLVTDANATGVTNPAFAAAAVSAEEAAAQYECDLLQLATALAAGGDFAESWRLIAAEAPGISPMLPHHVGTIGWRADAVAGNLANQGLHVQADGFARFVLAQDWNRFATTSATRVEMARSRVSAARLALVASNDRRRARAFLREARQLDPHGSEAADLEAALEAEVKAFPRHGD